MTRLACSLRRALAASAGLLALFASLRAAMAGVQYTVVDLGFGSSAVANAVNESGETTGVLGISTAFHYDNFVVTPLPGLPEYPKTYGNAINAAGTVAGRCVSPSIPPFPVWIPVIWEGTKVTVINGGGTQGGAAHDISDSGQVVGWSDFFGTERAFLWDGVTFMDLGTLHENPDGGYLGKSQAFAINNNNQIAGWAATDDYPGFSYVGFVYTIGQGMQSLGLYLGAPTSATDLNDSTTVVGYVDLPGTSDRAAFRWQDGAFIDLGTLGGTRAKPEGINNLGQIVGSSVIESRFNNISHGFLWQRGEMTDLNSLIDPESGWTIGFAFDINDSGQIAAMGSLRGNTPHAVRLDPIVPPRIPGDIDGDSDVDASDLALLLGSWGACAACARCPADLDGDCDVDAADLALLLGNWE